jgi:membrane fusion protein (multidrug efflux system)
MTEHIPADRLARSADPVSAPPIEGNEAKQAAGRPGVSLKRVFGILALIAAIALGGWYLYRYWTVGRFMVSTDDAYVKADMSVIAAKIGGYVDKVAVVENQSVKKGDLLVQIDPVDYRLAHDAAKAKIDTQSATIERITAQIRAQAAAIDQTHAMLVSAEADRIRAAAEYNRASELKDRGFGTPQRLEQARADRDRTVATIDNVKAQTSAAEGALAVLQAQRVEAERTRDELKTALDRADRDLDFATVRAPFDGLVGNKGVEPGAFLQPGSRLLVLVPLETAYVEANFKETQLGGLHPGQQATVRLDAWSDHPITGVVESVAPASGALFSLLPPENATGNFTKIVQRMSVRIRLPADALNTGRVRPGLSVIVDVDTRSGGKTADASPAAATH